MKEDKIIAIRDAHDICSFLKVDGITGAVSDINGEECLVSEFKLQDFLHMAKLLGYRVVEMGSWEGSDDLWSPHSR